MSPGLRLNMRKIVDWSQGKKFVVRLRQPCMKSNALMLYFFSQQKTKVCVHFNSVLILYDGCRLGQRDGRLYQVSSTKKYKDFD